MGHPDRPPTAGRLSRTLQDLSAVERWAEHIGTERPPASAGHSGPDGGYRGWDGIEFGVDTMTRTGMHHITHITARRRSGTGPAPEPAEGDRAVLRSSVRALLDMAGHESGPAHTVVALTPQGPRVLSCRLRGATDTDRNP
ncbi:hypothetical protein ACSHWO_36575 (plasmid) [Streptomyces sp. HUAS TT3]|uniref:hypothetical protein n=1 Tax=Streptomyces sp. HUAS TT3 TaxID=3447510 RepID=UPI003F65D5FE